MMKIDYVIFLFFVILVSLSFVCGGDNSTSTYIPNSSVMDVGGEVVVALEDGHFNTSFSDGSNGYCMEYMEEEAKTGDVFYKKSSDYYDSSVYLKRYFVDYTDYALKDKVVTQHMIWHFTDGFDGWRVNYTLVDRIVASDSFYGDVHVVDLGGGGFRVFDFCVLVSPYEHHQDYFCYKISDFVVNSSFTGNSSVDFNNSNTFVDGLLNNLSFNCFNESVCMVNENDVIQYTSSSKDTSVFISPNPVKKENNLNFKHPTSNPIMILSVGIILLTIIILIQNIIINNGGKK